jgi:hypothetical protein
MKDEKKIQADDAKQLNGHVRSDNSGDLKLEHVKSKTRPRPISPMEGTMDAEAFYSDSKEWEVCG